MKRITRIFSFIFAIVFVISIFPVAKIDAAEKKYKLALTGEYDLSEEEKVIYNYSKMLKNIKLEKVEGKNQWNLMMYAGTTVCLPYTAVAATDEVEVTSNSMYVRGNVLYSNDGGTIEVTANQSSYKLTKTVTNKVLTCKSYNEAGKCLSTLKIVVKILPYSAKLERTKLVTAEELYKLNFHKDNYSEFAWKNVISKYPEILLDGSYSPLYSLARHVVVLDAYGRQVPQYLYDKFEAEDVEELDNILYTGEPSDAWGYDYDLIEAALTATGEYQRTTQKDYTAVQGVLDSLELDRFETDWEKVLEIQKWVKSNIKYKVQDDPSVVKTLERGNGDCDCYAKLMEVACRLLDIPCYVIDDPDYMTVGHAWNIVLIDGLWCTMDLTEWDLGFGIVTTNSFTREPNVRAVSQFVEVFGGEALEKYDDLPEYVRNLIDLICFQRGHKEYLVERYYEWLDDSYDPEVDMDSTFNYYIMQRHLLKGFKKEEYEDWRQNDYNPEIHGVNALEYWYNNILSSKERCGDCRFILKYFPEEFDTIE